MDEREELHKFRLPLTWIAPENHTSQIKYDIFLIGAFFGGLPNVTFSQNVGIVTTTKVVNRWVAALAAIILGIAGILPKFSRSSTMRF